MITHLPGTTRPQAPARPSTRPRHDRFPPSQHNSVDINLPTPHVPLTPPHFSTGSGSSMDTGSIEPGPNPAPGVASTPCISTLQGTPGQVTPVTRVNASEASSFHNSSPQSCTVIASITCTSTPLATPVISANAPVFRCSSVTPGQVTPANTQANLNENNNSFKSMDCIPTTAISSSSKAVSTSLSAAPGPQVMSLSCPFHLPKVLTAQGLVCSRPPRHSPDHMTTASEISVTSTTQQSSAMLHPPHCPPDHVTLTLAVPMTITSEQQASVT